MEGKPKRLEVTLTLNLQALFEYKSSLQMKAHFTHIQIPFPIPFTISHQCSHQIIETTLVRQKQVLHHRFHTWGAEAVSG